MAADRREHLLAGARCRVLVACAGAARVVVACVVAAAGLAWPGVSSAKEARPASADPVLEARVMAIARELRCLVCQNQTIADSHSDLAEDLRGQVREMLRRGDSDAQVYAYMTERYGDFVLYRPPLQATTFLLWAGPAILLVGGMAALGLTLHRRSRLADDQFDAEPKAGEAEAAEAPALKEPPAP